MQYDRSGIRKRRRQRLAQVTKKQQGSWSASSQLEMDHRRMESIHNGSNHETYLGGGKGTNLNGGRDSTPQMNHTSSVQVLVVQLLISLLIFFSAYLIFHSNSPWALSAQSFTRDVFTRDFNFRGVSSWIETKLDQYPSLLPTIFLKEREQPAIPVYSQPLRGTVIEDFLVNGSGIIIESTLGREVHPITTGWVRFVGTTKDKGKTVIIQHSGGKESIYGFLGEVFVRTDDWVYPDTVIGMVEQKSLFLQIKEGKEFVDPMDVIPFD